MKKVAQFRRSNGPNAGFSEKLAWQLSKGPATGRELAQQLEALAHQQCGKCKEQLPVQSCHCQGESACWVTSEWHETKLVF
ncbi:hypothetical protein [Pantoea sp. Fr-CA_6]|uniref:hypothetical protein n=1 Tax=Pantoea sp. Fr-CA_6 TaxID=2929505 RepID=UPI002117A438|nr:hypothetical protein [Pantoea sp. Fr-CA_6]